MTRHKRITQVQRSNWLRQARSGTPLHEIAEVEKVRPATVKANIEIARQELEKQDARKNLLRDAMVRHNEQLLSAAVEVRDQLRFPPEERLFPVACFQGSSRATLVGLSIRLQDGASAASFEPEGEERKRVHELLRQHLADKRQMWRNVDRWRADSITLAELCVGLGRKACDRATELTHLRPVSADLGKEGFNEEFISWACRLALDSVRTGRPSRSAGNLRIVEDQLQLDGAHLAKSATRKYLNEAATAFRRVIDEFVDLPEAHEIVKLSSSLGHDAASIRTELTDVILYGLISGTCSVCG